MHRTNVSLANLVMLPANEQRRYVDLGKPARDIPIAQVAGDEELAGSPHRVVWTDPRTCKCSLQADRPGRQAADVPLEPEGGGRYIFRAIEQPVLLVPVHLLL